MNLAQRLLIGLVKGYRLLLSPWLGNACRFTPTCSHYAADAVRVHGAFRGTWLALRRLVKCTPLHPGGFNPVPPRHARPVCHSVPHFS